ncbi:MAG TPA: putative toxin-antitoxin system toxin component, PIN family [Archaeoglobaceae archaeon]|nr:putative toxin-antitoxin system toxin component, PIN family [Archaeoglobaceae archaeon]
MGKKAKVVLDTNIWISIFFNKIIGREFDDLFRSEKIEVFVSEEILQEISRVLEYQKIKKILKKSGISSRDVLEEILRVSKVVNPRKKLEVLEDPEDNKFLECALESETEYVVSGDKHMLRLKKFGDIKIISARELMERMK